MPEPPQDPGKRSPDIIATVGGSLLEPRVSLSGNSPFPIAESDLVSYLIFEPAGLRGGARQGMPRGATASLAVGLFSSELGSILTRDGGWTTWR